MNLYKELHGGKFDEGQKITKPTSFAGNGSHYGSMPIVIV